VNALVALALFLAADATSYKVTVDYAAVEVTNGRSIAADVGLRDTQWWRVLPQGADASLRAVEERSRETNRGQRFVVTNANYPARLEAVTSIPYTEAVSTWGWGPYQRQVTTQTAFVEVGSTLVVTVRPAGPNEVCVDIGVGESSASNAYETVPLVAGYPGDTRIGVLVTPPRVTRQNVVTSVYVPLGGAVFLAGLPNETVRSSSGGGVTARSSGRGTVVVGAGDATREYEMLMFLTVTESRPMTQRDADRMIQEMMNRHRVE